MHKALLSVMVSNGKVAELRVYEADAIEVFNNRLAWPTIYNVEVTGVDMWVKAGAPMP